MKSLFRLNGLTTLAFLSLAGAACAQTSWKSAKAPLMTRWAKEVSPTNALPEYPRPQLVRSSWQNLNGLWQYQRGKEGDALPRGRRLASRILVPFPVESALSGVMEHHDCLWYRRQFTVPSSWQDKRLKLNFGAVDYEAQVFVNGQSVGTHTGGYEPFSYDITRYLKGSGPQELIVRVFDPTDLGGQPRGKQTLNPGGIMYTPVSGIWQTVWLEPVARTSISSLHMVPDIDAKTIRVTVNAPNATRQTRAVVRIKEGARIVRTVTIPPNAEVAIALKNPKLWSPASPFLYSLDASLVENKEESDRVRSYFGMRKISVGQVNGVPRLLLNNKFVFQIGPLDQGYWPDGLYTAPTDAALRYDLEMTKKMGFNMTRKHLKVEPARWYYHADKLGLLVWQDMPSPNSYANNPPPLDKAIFERQQDVVITTLWNSPAIVMWVLINEGQGAYDERGFTARAKRLDPSRLVNRHSGGGNHSPRDAGDVGDVDDVHTYPAPGAPNPSTTQAMVSGEYGGIGYPVKGHTWKREAWGYTTINSGAALEDYYGEYTAMLKRLRDENGLSAAVYTQITDVEVEANGLMTYDRLLKAAPAQISLANRLAYPPPTYVPVAPISDPVGQTWKYTTVAPPTDWTQAHFDDSNWQSGQGAFGGKMEGGPRISTSWESDDIWMRRTFSAGTLSAADLNQLVLRNLHDDDLEVFINGVLAYRSGGAVHAYQDRAISEEAKRAIVPIGANILAVHCHEAGGDQHVDVGIYHRIPAKK